MRWKRPKRWWAATEEKRGFIEALKLTLHQNHGENVGYLKWRAGKTNPREAEWCTHTKYSQIVDEANMLNRSLRGMKAQRCFKEFEHIKSWEPDEGGSREQTSSRAVTHTWKLWKASREEMEPLRPPSDTGEPQQPIRAESRLMRMMKTQICLSFYSDVSRKRLPSVPPAPASSISSLLSRCCCLSHSAAKNGAVHCSSHLKPFSSCFTFTHFDQDLQVLLTCINVKELYNLEKLNKLNSSWWRWDGRTF